MQDISDLSATKENNKGECIGMSWIQDQLKERNDGKDTKGFFKLKDGKNVLTVDISAAPIKRIVDMDGKKRDYHDYTLVDPDHFGQTFSATGFLHSMIIKELSEYVDKDCKVATLEIRVEHPSATKTSYVVIAREVK
jgi:hypothetical protein